MTCRICSSRTHTLLDLGVSPPANSLKESRDQPEQVYPLVLELCDDCGNVQLRDCIDVSVLYSRYLYMTPDSTSLSKHYEVLRQYLADRLAVCQDSYVLEIGSNTGLFLRSLKPFVARVVGIDPAVNICDVANAAGVDTVCDFFTSAVAESLLTRYGRPNLIVARHCFAHNPDPHELLRGITQLLDDDGHFLIENAYVVNTIEGNEFDQVYHEHMFYYSIRSMRELLARHELQIVDVLMVPVHGGSIVFLVKKRSARAWTSTDAVRDQEAVEFRKLNPQAFDRFVENTSAIKRELRALIGELTAAGKVVYTYGATAKGNTLLNYVGLNAMDIPCCVDSTPIKQGRYLPGSNIPVIAEEAASRIPPDYFLLTAWNYQKEIIEKVRRAGNLRSRFIIPIPRVQTL